jgi:O-antigen ligase
MLERGSPEGGKPALTWLGLVACAVGASLSTLFWPKFALMLVPLPLAVASTLVALVWRPKVVLYVLIGLTAFAAGSIFIAAALVVLGGSVLVVFHGAARLQRLRAVGGFAAATVCMSLATFASALYAFDSLGAALTERTVYSPIFFLLLGALVYVFIDHRLDARRTLETVAGAGAVMALYSLAAYAVPALAFGGYGAATWYQNLGGLRATTGLFEFQNEFGGYLLLTSFTTLMVLELEAERRRRALWLAALGTEVVCLVLTLTLGALFALIVGLLIYGVLRFRRVGAVALFALLVGLILSLATATIPAVGVKLADVGARAAARLVTYGGGVNIVRQHLWFGIGPDQVLKELERNPFASATAFGISSHVPHNQFLLTAAELGLVGLLALVGLIASGVTPLLWGLRPRLRGTDRALWCAVVAMLVAFFEQNLTNNLLLHSRIGAMFFVVVLVLRRYAQLPVERPAAAQV